MRKIIGYSILTIIFGSIFVYGFIIGGIWLPVLAFLFSGGIMVLIYFAITLIEGKP